MTPTEIKDARLRAGLTQVQLAELLGVTARAVKHWESGSRKMPTPAWRLLLIELERRSPA